MIENVAQQDPMMQLRRRVAKLEEDNALLREKNHLLEKKNRYLERVVYLLTDSGNSGGLKN